MNPAFPGGPPGGPGADGRRGGAAESIGDILRRAAPEFRPSKRGPNRTRRTQTAVAAAWEKAAGPQLAAETHPATLHHGVLTVEVRSTALLAELQSFRVEDLLARLIEADAVLSKSVSGAPTGRVTGLRFRPGVF